LRYLRDNLRLEIVGPYSTMVLHKLDTVCGFERYHSGMKKREREVLKVLIGFKKRHPQSALLGSAIEIGRPCGKLSGDDSHCAIEAASEAWSFMYCVATVAQAPLNDRWPAELSDKIRAADSVGEVPRS
jgi:hypothetical protein